MSADAVSNELSVIIFC